MTLKRHPHKTTHKHIININLLIFYSDAHINFCHHIRNRSTYDSALMLLLLLLMMIMSVRRLQQFFFSLFSNSFIPFDDDDGGGRVKANRIENVFAQIMYAHVSLMSNSLTAALLLQSRDGNVWLTITYCIYFNFGYLTPKKVPKCHVFFHSITVCRIVIFYTLDFYFNIFHIESVCAYFQDWIRVSC